ncbi:acyltransferase [Bacillus sp. ISL-7]|uniref:acyltransferase family protein n=1 Tax=Bacillus sp. ISL-7 TaxID=2819136 RepID=UPI001BE5B312|nr:acyltransferase [Bacillus sp. ISL-7]MBT2736726.1 acyltransferase [Bacillus sp. ISL-7]
MNNRVVSLDYLRGLMALSVMIYHYTVWQDINLVYPIGDLFFKLGIYAVSCFYVLSGISLALVYSNKDVNMSFIQDFIKKRFYRIAPLFYMATTLTITLKLLVIYCFGQWVEFPTAKEILLNYTFLFSWFSPGGYIAAGTWSIGNELVFYSLFPIMIFLFHKGKNYLNAFFGITIVLTLIFSFIILDRSVNLENQWNFYINPLNQLYFFVGGVVIGAYTKFHNGINKKYLTSYIISLSLIFIFLPIGGSDQIFVATGFEKFVLSLCILGLCSAIAYWRNTKESKVNKVLKYFGDISYSLYLLHPIVNTILKAVFNQIQLNDTTVILVTWVFFTLISSSISYYLIEKPFTNMARKKIVTKEQPISKVN